MAVRVVDDADLHRAVKYGHTANTWFNACGLYCYGWDEGKIANEPKSIGATSLELDRVLAGVSTALRNLQ